MTKLIYLVLLCLPCLTFFQRTVFAEVFSGNVVSVADGDTITVINQKKEQLKIRLSSVDCPEKNQAFGHKAKDFTASMVAGKQVTVQPETIDKYGRTVAMVFVNGSNLNERIIANGYGWVYRKYCNASYCADWLKQEATARDAQIGLWADKNPVPPWDFRAEQRGGNNIKTSAGGDNQPAKVASSGVYHGNIKSHVFHGSDCQHYNCKNCTVRFGSMSDAVSAGYRPHRDCVKE